jgi:hypothetical protein
MLVALVFTGLLMAGMAGVFRGSVRTFTTVNETLGAQRTNRWAIEQITDDISQAGYLFPERVLPSFVLAAAESLFSITPDAAVTGLVRASDSNPGGTTAETLNADVLEYFSDVPLAVAGTWVGPTTGNDPNPGGTATAAPDRATITFKRGGYTDLKADDVMLILDSGEYGNWEHPLIAGATNPVVFETSATALANYTSTPIQAGISLPHPDGVPVSFVRPAQLTRYSVQAVALDPANAAIKLPALVRQQTSYPTSGTVDWSTVPTQLIAENVQGFRVDISFDGGTTWARSTGNPASWADIQANANTQLGSAGLPNFSSITASPDWFRNINALIRVDLTTRTPVRREEYSSTTGARAYRTRTQTLMISPRNFGYGQ